MSDLYRVKKLPDESFGFLVPDADLTVDGGKMCVKVIVSTETLDRERDILIAKGCRTANHQKNPAVLLNHRKDWAPIAAAEDPDGRYTVKTFDSHIESTNWFNQHNKLALQAFRLVESKALRGISPGFLTVPDSVHKVKAADGHPAFVHSAWDLIEISHCPIGMNPDALVLAVEKGFGGEALLPELKELLLPFVPERKPLVAGGWESKSMADDAETTDEPTTEIDLTDAEAVPLTPSSQFYHSVYQKTFDTFGMNEELRGILENDRTKSDARKISSLLGKVLDVCKAGHAGHVVDFPAQPGLPDELNSDVSEHDMAAWRVKALEAWDEHKASWRRAVAAENAADIKEAAEFLKAVANDRQLRTSLRTVAKGFVGRLERVKMVAMPPDDDDAEWAAIVERADKLAEKFAALGASK